MIAGKLCFKHLGWNLFLLCWMLFPVRKAHAQFQSEPQLGFQLGLVADFGSHVNNIGLQLCAYYTDFFYQLNASTQLKWNFTSYGDRKAFWENRNALGLALLGGKKDLEPDFQLDGLNHQTRFSNAIAFNYLWYYDQAGTSQRSGAWGLHINYFSLLFENDVFGGQAKDRFRTGSLQVNYRYKSWKCFTNLYIWTGETAGSTWIRGAFHGAPNGFRSLEDLPYGKTSHGIWSFGANHSVPGQQFVTFKTGIDSEQVRHLLQNRLTHDLILFPKSMQRNTPHYPRLGPDGCPVFEKSDIRPNRFYFQTARNESWAN
jgi:hypothetical protein